MKKRVLSFASLAFLGILMNAQEIKFEEYDLPNGLHVILHKDNSAPTVTTSVYYSVGSKDEVKGRTGFAHFFEHLLFEGTKISNAEIGLRLYLLMVVVIMLQRTMTEHITMKISRPTMNNLDYGWKQKECVML